MTAQFREQLTYKGEQYSMATEPLSEYLEKNNIEFVFSSTACWRGYIGSWSIENDRLYLTDLKATIENYEEVGIEYLFPDSQKVFDEWFSGEIRIPYGELLEYIHMGYDSIYEKELFLTIKDGVVVDQCEITYDLNSAERQVNIRNNKKFIDELYELFNKHNS